MKELKEGTEGVGPFFLHFWLGPEKQKGRKHGEENPGRHLLYRVRPRFSLAILGTDPSRFTQIAPVRSGNGVMEKKSKFRSHAASNAKVAVGPAAGPNTSSNSAACKPIRPTGPIGGKKPL
jgi:hypothetical protein